MNIYGNLTDINYLKSRLKRAGIKPQRSAGQNFLICPEVVEATVMAITGGPKKITELGAGVGTLTVALLAAGFAVKAIEREQQLAKAITKEVPSPGRANLKLETGDLRKVDWRWSEDGSIEQKFQLVGNIPYNLSGLIIRRLVQLEPQPERVVLMVQWEVGERIVAQPPKMGLLGLAVSLWGKSDIIVRVPADCFWPKPKVGSCLIMLSPHGESRIKTEEREKVMAVAKPFFMAKRKQMAGVLKQNYKLMTREEAEMTLKKANIKGTQRPQEVAVEQWRALASVL
ncbi:MAG: ribosomal RNA small subunit methyltransferase A [Candidatus Andersenbacteria bacterium RIFCSPHIGHO2_12_FULL_46_9]|nr:MAG: ribosomal RNA small subunit methyltransferase A [Candidatus Andersenbacteria bacterium RIFCSPHIGHO2_02_FULL_46_16]OGY37389.1 MAG: ribosomal RNA small subunit methyltransferase A [Candidatus Andersenbacteria bacterium RIFCSPHIGHO2_12_FULL_46_9]OGY37470.1 MAG: ribosomal RNA small subunit methyltransferase A [Candidatus Andersenbacteria bacterium RIFCSPLOWO2_02_FULL_46_11]OGY39851.1 MAG: ribosomal RNA small subunit methyltransferase A [Candidatus Andersenbacteria bacterium RIFCSPLOWO2_12_FU